MAKNIEMNVLNESGQYEALWPNVGANSVVDFSGDNPLLSESTASLYSGLSSNPNPNEVFNILSKAALYQNGEMERIDGTEISQFKGKMGSYRGANNGQPVTIQFDFQPDVFMLYLWRDNNGQNWTTLNFIVHNNLESKESSGYMFFIGNAQGNGMNIINLSFQGSSISFQDQYNELNRFNTDYYYYYFKLP